MKTTRDILLRNLGKRIAEIDESLLPLIEVSMLDMANSALFQITERRISSFAIQNDICYERYKLLKDNGLL